MAPRKGRIITAVSLSPEVCDLVADATSKTGINGRDIINAALELAFGIRSPHTDHTGHADILLANTALGNHISSANPTSAPSDQLDTSRTPNQCLDELFVADMSGEIPCSADRTETVRALQHAISLLSLR